VKRGAERWRQRAREWLARHRLPADEATVGFVAERLRARRRGWLVSLVVGYGIVGLTWWQWGIDVERPGWTLTLLVALGAADLARRWLVWSRLDRRLIAARPVRATTLSPPSWADLVGPRALRRAAVLLGAGLVVAVAAYPLSGPTAAGLAAFVVVAVAAHAGLVLELARRRPMPAGDETALAVNDRLRGEEAGKGAESVVAVAVFVPMAVSGSDVTVFVSLAVPFFVAGMYTLQAARHRYAYEFVDGELVAR
jgi:hypothetical protein